MSQQHPDRWKDVLKFMAKFGQSVGSRPAVPTKVVDVFEKYEDGVVEDHALIDFRMRLIEEEYKELKLAIEDGDLARILDAIIDLEYVLEGLALTYGMDTNVAWKLVHDSNMAKEGGAVRDDGKILKPEGWKPPDIDGALEEMSLEAAVAEINEQGGADVHRD